RRHTSFSRDWSSDVCSSDLSPVTADSGDLHFPDDVAVQGWPWTDACRAGAQQWHVVEGVDLVEGKFAQQTIVDHRLRAETIFFCRLEDDQDVAPRWTVSRQVLCGAEQGGGMAVMTATVGDATSLRSVDLATGVLHRQCIHVGTQGDGRARRQALNQRDHASTAHASDRGQTHGLELFRDQGSGAMLAKCQLGMSVQLMTPCCHLRG